MSAPVPERAAGRRWAKPLVIAGFGVLFAWDVWEAVQNLVTLPRFVQEGLGLGADQVPWWLLVLDLALPILAFAGALLIARRRRAAHTALALLAGLALVAAWSLTLASIAPLALASLL